MIGNDYMITLKGENLFLKQKHTKTLVTTICFDTKTKTTRSLLRTVYYTRMCLELIRTTCMWLL